MPATNGLTFNTVPDSVTQRALSHNFSVEEKTRREEMILNKDFYYDKQEQQLTLVTDDVDPATINLTKPIIKKRSSLLYRKKLTREMEGPAQSISFLEAVYKDNSIDSLLNTVDRLAELTGSVLIHPMRSDDLIKYPSGWKLQLFDSSQFSAVSSEEDPQEAEAISLVKEVLRLSPRSTSTNPQVEKVLVQQVWTRDSVVKYNSVLNNNNPTNKLMTSESNPLGFLPFINVKGEEVHDQYLGHAPATLIRKMNETVNQTLTNLLHIIKMQGFTPIALSGYQSGESVTIHPGRAFSLPSGAAAEVLDTNPKIKEMLDVLLSLEEKLFETSSVPKVSVVGGEGESGRELMIRFFPLLQVFQDKAVMFEKYELELANLILRVAGLPPLVSLLINYPEDNVLPFSSDDDSLLQDIQLNLKTPVDELMKRDPDLTEEEATALYLANVEFNRTFSDQSQEDNTEDPDASEDSSDKDDSEEENVEE